MRKHRLYLFISRAGSLSIIGGLFLYFSVTMPDIWLTTYNLLNLIEQTVALGLVGLGFTIVRACGEVDLSVGSMTSFASMIVMAMIVAERSILLSIAVALLAGAVVGVSNGLMRTTLRIPGVIPTIGSQSVVAGLAMIVGWGNMIYGRNPTADAFCTIGRGYIGPVSIPAIILGVSAFVVWFLLGRTRYGRLLYMIGSNPDASRLSGVRVNAQIMVAYILCGLFAAFSGVMMAARIGAGNPIGGGDTLLDVIIAVMIGSTVGAEEQEFSALGSLIGAFFVTLVMTGMQMSGGAYHIQCLMRGLLLLSSLTLFSLRKHAAE